MIPCEKPKLVVLLSILKVIVVFLARTRFLVKLICCIDFGSASIACCLLKSIQITLEFSLK